MPTARDPRAPTGGRLTASQNRAWVAYLKVQLRITHEMNRQLQADSELSLSDYDVLVAVGQGRGMQIAELAAHLGWERSRLSHHLRRMGQRGLVERHASRTDARATGMTLTAKGRQALNMAVPGHVALVRRLVFDSLSEDLLASFTAALEHVNVNLDLYGSLPQSPN